MTNQKHCPYPKKQSAPPLIPSDPDGIDRSSPNLPIDAKLLANSCRDDSDTTDPALVVDAIDLLRKRGFRVVVSGRGSHSEESQHQQAPPRFLKIDTVSDRAAMGKSTILAWETTGRFPRAVRLSATLRVWLETDVNRWVNEQHAKAIGTPTGTQSAVARVESVSERTGAQ